MIGLFPPFHRFLVGAAALAGVLFIYVVLLIRIRAIEVAYLDQFETVFRV